MPPRCATPRAGAYKRGEGARHEDQPGQRQGRGEQRPVKGVGAREQSEHRAIAEQQQADPQRPAGARPTAQPNSDRMRTHRRQRGGQARWRSTPRRARSGRSAAPSIALQPGEARSSGRTTVATIARMGEHGDGEEGHDRAPSRALRLPAALEQGEAAHDEDHRQRRLADQPARAPPATIAAGGVAGPAAGRSSAPSAAPPSFRGTGR